MMFLARDSRASSSRKSGCAIEMRQIALSATDLPLRLTIPYSVTTYMVSVRGVVTIFPGVRVATIRLTRWPAFSHVEDRQRNDFPPWDAYAPRTNCNCPPVPLMCRSPIDSEAAWPCRSSCVEQFMDTTLSFLEMLSGVFV